MKILSSCFIHRYVSLFSLFVLCYVLNCISFSVCVIVLQGFLCICFCFSLSLSLIVSMFGYVFHCIFFTIFRSMPIESNFFIFHLKIILLDSSACLTCPLSFCFAIFFIVSISLRLCLSIFFTVSLGVSASLHPFFRIRMFFHFWYLCMAFLPWEIPCP